jgi:hypothetical protein
MRGGARVGTLGPSPVGIQASEARPRSKHSVTGLAAGPTESALDPFAVKRFGVGVSLLPIAQFGHIRQPRFQFERIGARGFSGAGQAITQQRLSLRIVSATHVGIHQVLDRRECVGVFRAVHLAPERQRFLAQLESLVPPAGGGIVKRQVLHRRECVGVLLAEYLAAERQHFLE